MEKYSDLNTYRRSVPSRALGKVKGTRNFLLHLKGTLGEKALTRENFFLAASFLMGRALLFAELAPFGLAMWALLYREKRDYCPKASLFLLGGAYSVRSIPGASSLLVGMVCIVFLEKFFETRKKKITLPLPLLAALGVAAGRLPFMAAGSFVPYDSFILLLEIALVVPVAAFLAYGSSLALSPEREEPLRQEELIGALFFTAFLFLGLAEGPAWVTLTQEALVKAAVMVLAFLHGGALGASTGLVLGIFLGIGTYDYTYIALLAFAGLLAGIFREMGKAGVVLGFLMGILLCSFYLGGVGEVFLHLPQAGIGSLVFLLLPQTFFYTMKSFSPAFSLLTGSSAADEEVRHMTSRRLKELARVFQRIAKSFKDIADSGREPGGETRFFTELGRRACRECGSYEACWQDGFALTLGGLKEAMEESTAARVTIRDLPFSLRKKCRYLSRLLKTLNGMLDQYRLEAAGRRRLQEGRVMVAGQLEGLSAIINDLSNEVKLKLDAGDKKEKPRHYHAFTVEMGVSQLPKEGQETSGDYYSLLTLKEGKQVIILSDGMGSGPRAKDESKGTVNLLEDLLEAGFSRDLVIRTVNTVMQLRSSEETFATVDLALIDLQEGKVEICKIGAAPSFIKRGEQVKELAASTLPLGILSQVEMESKKERLQDGDLLVMVTDGVSEAGVNVSGNTSSWVKHKLLDIRHAHPQLVADHILQGALERNRGQAFDDMSIIVCKVLRLRGS